MICIRNPTFLAKSHKKKSCLIRTDDLSRIQSKSIFCNSIMLNMEQHGEIILYQPDETVKLEVRLEDETVWLKQYTR